ncbi:MAG: hypothetical protein IPM98_12260 [Lewinellaceae bacterium]|nr:hypothetical protein [Lewinellaceae bacterium]
MTLPGCDCTMEVAAKADTQCDKGTVRVDIEVTVQNPAGSGFNIILDNKPVPGGPYPYSTTGNKTVKSIQVPGDGQPHAIQVADAGNADCNARTTVVTSNCDEIIVVDKKLR